MRQVSALPAIMRRSDGTSAVEFALVAPIFMLSLFGVVAYGSVMATYSAIQQLTAEGARAGIAGLSSAERDQLVRTAVSSNVLAYPLLDPSRVTVSIVALPGTPPAYKVTINYDMSGLFYTALSGIVPLPASSVTRTAVVYLDSYSGS